MARVQMHTQHTAGGEGEEKRQMEEIGRSGLDILVVGRGRLRPDVRCVGRAHGVRCARRGLDVRCGVDVLAGDWAVGRGRLGCRPADVRCGVDVRGIRRLLGRQPTRLQHETSDQTLRKTLNPKP